MTDPTRPPHARIELSANFPGAELTDDEVEFARAMCEYQRRYRRRYPAWSEVLYVLRLLGYAKTAEGYKPRAESEAAPIQVPK